MRAVVARVKQASVCIDQKVCGEIGPGLLVLLGIGPEDTKETASRLAGKIIRQRIFEDEQGRMNCSLEQSGGGLLVVSQFTLYADLSSRRPGFSHAAASELAEPLYEYFLQCCADLGFPPQHGQFGADMQVSSVNDGPVTLCYDLQ